MLHCSANQECSLIRNSHASIASHGKQRYCEGHRECRGADTWISETADTRSTNIGQGLPIWAIFAVTSIPACLYQYSKSKLFMSRVTSFIIPCWKWASNRKPNGLPTQEISKAACTDEGVHLNCSQYPQIRFTKLLRIFQKLAELGWTII